MNGTEHRQLPKRLMFACCVRSESFGRFFSGNVLTLEMRCKLGNLQGLFVNYLGKLADFHQSSRLRRDGKDVRAANSKLPPNNV